MASYKSDVTTDPSILLDDEDIRGDGKKRKFKPLSAVRRFFRPKKKKDETVVTVKALSTTAIPPEDEDDDDGGFKAHSPIPLAGTRSLSEDSVFSNETREPSINKFPTAATSTENISKTSSAFQSELLSKLTKRRSLYSDDERDDGLPRSPVPPVTTADVISQKPGTSGKKSTSRDSDLSLTSVGSSEEDLFGSSNWKNRVPAKKSSADHKLPSADGGMDSIDFCSIQKTEVLNNAAAKDKISIKPKARSRQSRKKRDTASPQTLPSLNEESPTKYNLDEASSLPSLSGYNEDTVSPKDKSPESPKTFKKTSDPMVTSIKGSPKPSKKVSDPVTTSTKGSPKPSKKVSDPVTTSTKGSPKPSKKVSDPVTTSTKESPKLSSEGLQLSFKQKADKLPAGLAQFSTTLGGAAMAADVPVAYKVSTPTSPNQKPSPMFKPLDQQAGSPPSSPIDSSVKAWSEINIAFEKPSAEKITASGRVADKLPSTVILQEVSNKEDDQISIESMSRAGQLEIKSQTSEPGLKVTDPTTLINLSPKEDYKLKRQVRSKTLPGTIEEQSSPRVQRTSSHRIQISTSGSPEHQAQPTFTLPSEQVITSPQTPPVSASVKKLENLKFGSPETHEHPWKEMMRKKREERDETEGIVTSSESQGSSKPMSQSGFVKQDKKIESVSFWQKDQLLEKKLESPSVESPTKTSLTKKESLEIDVADISSVKGPNKTLVSSQEVKPVVPASMPSAERKLHQGTGSLDKDDVPKPQNKEIWGGSAKVMPSFKQSDTVSSGYRPGSVKMPAAVSSSLGFKMMTASAQPSSFISKQVKTDVPSVSKHVAGALSSSTPSIHSPPQIIPTMTSTAPEFKVSAQPPKPSSGFTAKSFASSQPITKPGIPAVTPSQPASPFGAKPLAHGSKHPTTEPALSASSSVSPTSGSLSSSVDPLPLSASTSRPFSMLTQSISKPQASSLVSSKSTLQNKVELKTEEKKPEVSSSVPAWRANLAKNEAARNEVKIEIIEKTPTPNSQDLLRNNSEKTKNSQITKKSDSVSSGSGNNNASSSNRTSKVMDMVKNFQNLKVTS